MRALAGARVVIASAKGSTFWVDLPMEPSAVAAVVAEPAPSSCETPFLSLSGDEAFSAA